MEQLFAAFLGFIILIIIIIIYLLVLDMYNNKESEKLDLSYELIDDNDDNDDTEYVEDISSTQPNATSITQSPTPTQPLIVVSPHPTHSMLNTVFGMQMAEPASKINCIGSNPKNYNLIGNILKKNKSLSTCDGLISSTGNSISVLQADGNWVLYNTNNDTPIWQTGTKNTKVPSKMYYQDDSNLVLFGPDNEVMWTSETIGKPSDSLILQDDSNLVLYSANNTVNPGLMNAIWATNTDK